MHLLQTSVATDSYSTYLQFSRGVRDVPAVYLRDLLEFNFADDAISIDEVEAITEIRKRFVTSGMSLGALSPEAHETLAIATNRIGAKSSDEHPTELQILMRISYAVIRLKKNKTQ